MTTATLIKRMTSTLKAEAVTAAAKVDLYGYTISSDLKTIIDDDGFYPMLYFLCGEEVIAVPDFYIGEDGVSLTGSRGGNYELRGETLYAE
jgi:hypothetical protein